MVNSPFIFLTYSLGIANLFIEGRLTQEDIQNDPTAFLLSNQQSNNTILSFVHNYGFDEGMFIDITLLDPLSEFEGRFLTPNLKDVISKIKNFTKTRAEVEDNINYFLSDLKSPPREDPASQIDNFIVKANRIFIVYGSNQDKTKWSGPFTAQVTQVKSIINEEGIRQIEMRLIPSNSYFDVARIGLNKLQKVFPNSTGDTYFGTKINANDLITQGLDNNFHKVITQLLESYIRCLLGDPNANVFVILPNLDYYLRDYYDTVKKKYFSPNVVWTKKDMFWDSQTIDRHRFMEHEGSFIYEVLRPLGVEVRWEEKVATKPTPKEGDPFYIAPTNPLFPIGTPQPTITRIPYFVLSDFYAKEFDLDKARTLLDLITNLTNFITDHLTESIAFPEFDYFTETNTQVIDIWERELTNIVKIDKTKPVYIYGDPSLILATFYANASTGQDFIPESPTTLSERDTKIGLRCNSVRNIIHERLGTRVTPRDQDTDIAEFNYNVENPNILNLEVRENYNLLPTLLTDKTYISEYLSIYANTEFAKNIYDKMFDKINKEARLNFTNFLGRISDSIRKTISTAQAKEGDPNPLRFTSIGKSESNFVKQALESVSDFFKLDQAQIFRYTKIRFPSEKLYVAAQYEKFKKLQNFIFTLGVKTLPKFQYNSSAFLMKQPVAVSIRLPTATGFNSTTQDITNTYLSGVYVIRGFKHTIRESDAYSEFVLYKRVEHGT